MEESRCSSLRQRVVRVLEEQRQPLEQRYVRALLAASGPHYAARPEPELERTTRRSIDAYLAVLGEGDWAPMEQFIGEISQTRLPQQFPLSEVQRAFAGFRQQGVPLLVGCFQGEELTEALLLLDGAVDETIQRFSDRYQELDVALLQEASGELGKAHRVLREQYEEVAEAAAIKARFFANMSHELRSPMNSIIGYTELLLDGLDGPVNDDQRGSLGRILSSSRYLLKLINDVLDLSKLEAGKMDVHAESFDVGPLVGDAVDTVRPLAYRKRLDLRVELEPGLDRFVGDADKVKLVLINLLANAVKFTSEGEVVCGARRVGGGLELTVRDTGIGIDDGDRDRIFHKFYQAEGAKGQEFRGTGLGLPLSLMLVELMGGTLDLESRKGSGSRFQVFLPAESTGRAREEQPRKRTKVLVVEDDAAAMDLLVKMLEADGLQVLRALGGDEGLFVAKTEHPSVITLDLLMPGKDGWALLAELKSDPVLRAIPVVVVSCVDRSEEALRRGAAAYVGKPIDREKLVKTVRELARVADDLVP